MRQPKRFLAVTLVAVALCADRLAVAAPSLRPEVGQVARQLANRLAVSFRRVLPAVRLEPTRRSEPLPAERATVLRPSDVQAHPVEFSPFRYRLPPPAIV